MLSDLEGGGAGLAMAPPAQPHYRVAALAYRVKAAPEKAEKEKEKIKPESIAEAKAPAAAASRSQDEAASAAAGEKSGLYGQPDEVKLTLSLSREERRVMVDVFSEGKDPDSLSGEERETLRSVSERIGKYLDEAMAKNKNDRARVEKAFGEWFARQTRGEHQGPLDLINLLHQAAMGTLDSVAAAE